MARRRTTRHRRQQRRRRLSRRHRQRGGYIPHYYIYAHFPADITAKIDRVAKKLQEDFPDHTKAPSEAAHITVVYGPGLSNPADEVGPGGNVEHVYPGVRAAFAALRGPTVIPTGVDYFTQKNTAGGITGYVLKITFDAASLEGIRRHVRSEDKRLREAGDSAYSIVHDIDTEITKQETRDGKNSSNYQWAHATLGTVPAGAPIDHLVSEAANFLRDEGFDMEVSIPIVKIAAYSAVKDEEITSVAFDGA